MSEDEKDVWDKDLPNLADKKRKQLVYGREFYTKKECEKMRKKEARKKVP